MFLTGCTSKVITKTVIVQPEPFKFIKIDVNLSKIQDIPKLDLTDKVQYTDETKAKVEMDTSVWEVVRTISKIKTKVILREKLQKQMTQKALQGMLDQVDLYNQVIKDRNDTRIDKTNTK